MDVLQLLDNELKTKSNWSLEEKARYLYIRSCQLFSYDARYQCDLFWNTYGENIVKREILNKKINLRDVQDFLVVCKSYSKYVYNSLLKELLDIYVSVDNKSTQGRIHFANSFTIGKKIYYADATGKADIERIKLGLATNGYYQKMKFKFINNINLKKKDKKIGYLKNEYFKSILLRRVYSLEDEYYETIGQLGEEDEIRYFLFQLEVLKEIFDETNVFREYSDAFFFINYLFNHFFDEDILKFNHYNSNDLNVVGHNLVDITDGKWNFINILDIDFRGEKFSFILESVAGKYEFYEIPTSEGNYYKKELRHYNKKY